MGRDRLDGAYETWHQWRKVCYGAGSVKGLADELNRLGVTRPLVITTRSLSVRTHVLGELIAGIGAEPVAVLPDARSHVPFQAVAAMAATAGRLGVDGIISFGGGSCVDSGKAVALLCAGEFGSFADLMAVAGGESTAIANLTPHVAVPTTLSGAEFTNTLGITDPSYPRKLVVSADAIAPETIVLDPCLTRATPRELWATTGVKTLSDAIELLWCPVGSPVVDALASTAIRHFAMSLEPSLSGETDARTACQVATWLTMFGIRSTAVGTGVGVALRHQVGAACGSPHGEIASVLLPHVVNFNGTVVGHRLRDVARSLEIEVSSGAADEDICSLVVVYLDRLLSRIGVPRRLRDIGVPAEALAGIAENALVDDQLKMNPRPATAPDLLHLLEAAF